MSGLPSLELTEFGDLDLVYQAFRAWNLDAVQLDPGATHSSCRHLFFDDLAVMRDQESHASVTDYRLPEATTLFALPRAGTPVILWCGLEQPDEVLLINPSGRDYLAIIPGGYDAINIVVANALLAELELLPEALMSGSDISTRRMVPLGRAGARLRGWLFRVFDSVDALQTLTRCPMAATLFRDRLLGALGAFLERGLEGSSRPAGLRRACRYGLARRAYDVVEERLAEPLSTAQLARDLNVSPRVLQYAFRDVFQISPYQYVLKRKLQGVRRELRDRSASEATVSELALQYGFGELGRFSRYYRQMFGEVPSAMRARRPQAARAGSDGHGRARAGSPRPGDQLSWSRTS